MERPQYLKMVQSSYFRRTVREWIILSDRIVIGGSVANMIFRKDDGRVIERNFIFIGLICRVIGMHRFRFISGFVFNAGFVRIGGMILSCRAISVSRVGKWYVGLDGAFKRGIGTRGMRRRWMGRRIVFGVRRWMTRRVRRLCWYTENHTCWNESCDYKICSQDCESSV